MPSPSVTVGRNPVLAGLAACLVVLALSACGRRGPLEPPPSTAATPPTAASRAASKAASSSGTTSARPANLAASPNAVTEDTAEDETATAENDATPSLVPTPNPNPAAGRRRNRAFTIPKDPFILDPLL